MTESFRHRLQYNPLNLYTSKTIVTRERLSCSVDRDWYWIWLCFRRYFTNIRHNTSTSYRNQICTEHCLSNITFLFQSFSTKSFPKFDFDLTWWMRMIWWSDECCFSQKKHLSSPIRVILKFISQKFLFFFFFCSRELFNHLPI